MNIDLLKEKFNIELINAQNSFDKISISTDNICDLLIFLKEDAEFDFDRLNTIIAVDNGSNIELIYDLFSTNTKNSLKISVKITDFKAFSVVKAFKSAYFDECEIFDLFGVKFINNPDLKRLLLPKDWIGHPLLKKYIQDDERLAWNK